MIGSISDLLAFKAWSPELCEVISISAHHGDFQSFAQIAISVPDRRKWLTSDGTHGQWTNAQTSARGSWLASLIISYPFYTRSVMYKKQGAPGRHSIQLLLLLAHASPCHIQKGRGSLGMCSRFSIWLTKFLKVFTDQQISSSMVWLIP
jgi:hypothetical protein